MEVKIQYDSCPVEICNLVGRKNKHTDTDLFMKEIYIKLHLNVRTISCYRFSK